jgi:hypothetical protein
MNRHNLLLGAVVLGIVVIGVIWATKRHAGPVQTAQEPPGPGGVAPSPVPAIPTPAEELYTAPPRLETVVPQEGGEPLTVVRVRPDQVLATVNNIPITLKDLMVVGTAQDGAEQSMSPDVYEFLLNRAIERELTFQAARAQGIRLTEEQQRQLDQIGTSKFAGDIEDDGSPVAHLNVPGTAEQRRAFEVRDATAFLLQASLLAKAGVASPHVTSAQVEQYYRQHIAEYGQLPADAERRWTAWQQIDLAIRQRLARQVQQEYDEAVRELLDQLRANASVQVTPAS